METRKMLTISRIDQDLLPLLKAGAETRGLYLYDYCNEQLWVATMLAMADIPELHKMLPPDLDPEANPNFAAAQNRMRWLNEIMKLVKKAIDSVRLGSI